MDLALNNLQRLIRHKTHQTKPNHQIKANLYNFALPKMTKSETKAITFFPLLLFS